MTNGKWMAYRAADVGINDTFGGSEGNYTATPERDLGGDDTIRVYVADGRVMQIEVGGVVYTYQNADGVNIHGGNHTTSEWFTFDCGGFVAPDGSALTGRPEFSGAYTLTCRTPQSAPCFGPETLIDCWDGFKAAENIVAGDFVMTDHGPEAVLWAGGRVVDVSEKNAPITVRGEVFSPQHLLRFRGHWARAKHLVDLGEANYVTPRPATQWYGHILLRKHAAIYTGSHLMAESLNPTDRALSGMTAEMRAQIRDALTASGIERDQYLGPDGHVLTRRDMRELFGVK